MLIMLHIISKQVTCGTTEALCAGTVVEAKVRAVKTGLSLGGRVPEGISIVIQSVAWEYSGYPCLSLHLQNMCQKSLCPRLLTMNTSCFSGTYFIFILCLLMCMYVCGCTYHSRCNLYKLLLECGPWGSNWGVVPNTFTHWTISTALPVQIV